MRIRLGGVPEHFNYMWQLPAARELMRRYGIVYQWADYPGGTGAMSTALAEDDLDMAIMLTEGAIAAISDGRPFRILFPFVMSPLQWGVFSSKTHPPPDDLPFGSARFAISRFHSGSHLMAKFLAQRHNAVLGNENFVLSHDLKGAREKLALGDADFFLWEKYMTRPLVRSGEFRQTDEVSAPWPSFVFVVNKNFDLLDTDTWKQAVYELTSDYLEAEKGSLISGICRQYDLTLEDAEEWLAEVRYYDNNNYWTDRLTAAVIIMHSKGMIANTPELHELIGDI